jgi:CheY-like chemotaxis protein
MTGVEPPEPLRVLIVDDCADTTSSLAWLVQLWGYQAHTARDGHEALRLAAQHHPHVILLDIGLPGMTGWELVPRLRLLPGLEQVFVAVVSGYGRDEDVHRSQEVHCDLHLTKPVHPERLHELLAARQKEKCNHVS